MEEKIDKRTKEYKEANNETSRKVLELGFIHLHSPLFFAKKNFKEKLDTRVDKGPAGGKIYAEMHEDDHGRPVKLVMRCKDNGQEYEISLPATSVFSYASLKSANKISPNQTVSNQGANLNIQAQVSGPHDHVFAGQGMGQTGLGAKVK